MSRGWVKPVERFNDGRRDVTGLRDPFLGE